MPAPATAPKPGYTLSPEELASYDRDGYLIVRGLFKPHEVQELRERYEQIGREGKPIPGHWDPDLSPEGSKDPLKRYPRVLMTHRFDPIALKYFLDPRNHDIVAGLFREEPIGTQSMVYFKPPGAKGQALHQDNFYLHVKPGSCMASWTAIDPSTPENGGLFVVPGTHRMDVVCPELADETQSFTTHLVRPPAGLKPIPATLAPGDTLFFHGSVIHGSEPNRSQNQWRLSFICHYMPWSARQISQWFFPLLTFDGKSIERTAHDGGGPCGTEKSAFFSPQVH